MTRLAERDLYQFPKHNDTATCEECGAEIDVPDPDDPDPDGTGPFWRRKIELGGPLADIFEALCYDCYAEAVHEDISGGEGR